MSIRNLTAITGLPFTANIEDWTDKIPRKSITWEDYPKWKIVRGVYYWADGTYTQGYVNGKSAVIIPKGFRPFDFDVVDTIIVHHFASEASLENNANYYKNSTDEPSLPYHVVVDTDRLLQINDLMSMTFHCGANNTHTISISIRGDLSKRQITQRERELLYIGILSIKSAVPTIKYIKGHNELNNTSCPCISMDQVREDIKNLEMSLKADDTWSAKVTKVNQLANQYTYMTNLMKAGELDGDAKWACEQLLKVREIMIERKLLNP
jgi:hypothetical protein